MSVAGTPLEQCSACGGLWIAVEAFDRVCNDREAHTAATGLKLPALSKAPENIRYIACPDCAKLMNRMNYAGGSGIIVDICRAHGIWLDRDELRHVVEFIQAGGIQRVRNREIETLRLEREALERQRVLAPSNLSGMGSYDSSNDAESPLAWIDLIGEIICWLRR